MTELFWQPLSWEEIKARKYIRPPKSVGLKRLPQLSRVLRMEAIRHGLIVETPSKKQASKRGHRHAHNRVFLPVKPPVSPAEYRRRSKQARRKK